MSGRPFAVNRFCIIVRGRAGRAGGPSPFRRPRSLPAGRLPGGCGRAVPCGGSRGPSRAACGHVPEKGPFGGQLAFRMPEGAVRENAISHFCIGRRAACGSSDAFLHWFECPAPLLSIPSVAARACGPGRGMGKQAGPGRTPGAGRGQKCILFSGNCPHAGHEACRKTGTGIFFMECCIVETNVYNYRSERGRVVRLPEAASPPVSLARRVGVGGFPPGCSVLVQYLLGKQGGNLPFRAFPAAAIPSVFPPPTSSLFL